MSKGFIYLLLAGLSNVSADIASLKKTCESIELPNFEDFDIISMHRSSIFGYSTVGLSSEATLPATIDFCQVNVTLTHPGANDTVITSIWLPFSGWNGRFQATGGGGLAAGSFDTALAPAVADGYVAGSTDAGLSLNNTISAGTGFWALTPEGKLNNELIKNFAYRSIHDMTVIGKATTRAFFKKEAHHSYYTGCSTGGRQGYFAAKHYPNDFDGIMANAPAIYTPQSSPGGYWPIVVMENIVAPPQCVFSAFQAATIDHCDPQDGIIDGLISAPEKCNFDPKALIGQIIYCTETGGLITITTDYANVAEKIIQGARSASGDFLWFGNPPGAAFDGLANTTVVNNTVEIVPFSSGEAFLKYFIAQNPNLDTKNMSFTTLESLFYKSVELFSDVLGTENPDLTPFKKSGGKLLTWHGMADALIGHPRIELYWNTLKKNMGGGKILDEFYRVFLAPGVAHCRGGYGPVPSNPIAALVNWVEKGNAPDTLFASSTVNGRPISRNLCHYPEKIKYKGFGDLNDADSFTCSKSS